MDAFSAVVTDPEVPFDVQMKLKVHPEQLIPFAVPSGRSPAEFAAARGAVSAPKRRSSGDLKTVMPWPSVPNISGGRLLIIIVIMIIFWPCLVLLFAWISLTFTVNVIGLLVQFIHRHFQDRRHLAWERDAERAAIAYHGRYVAPDGDLDVKARLAWDRATTAAAAIQASATVSAQLVDSARILSAIPYHLWDIAERSARLSQLRQRLSAAMRALDVDSARVQSVSQPLQQTSAMAADDIETRVQQLEELADLLRRADQSRGKLLRQEREARKRIADQKEQARKQEQAFFELEQINDLAYDILPLVGGSDVGPGVTESEADDVRQVIRQSEDSLRRAKEEEALRYDTLRQANEEALRRAGEAVHSLIIPDAWPPAPGPSSR
jgi:hypothetical protein